MTTIDLLFILLAGIFVINLILKSPIDLFTGFGSWFLIIKRRNKK